MARSSRGEQGADDRDEHLIVDRLCHEVVAAGGKSTLTVAGHYAGADRDDRDFAACRPDRAHRIEAAHARESDVHQDEGRRLLRREHDCGLPVRR